MDIHMQIHMCIYIDIFGSLILHFMFAYCWNDGLFAGFNVVTFVPEQHVQRFTAEFVFSVFQLVLSVSWCAVSKVPQLSAMRRRDRGLEESEEE